MPIFSRRWEPTACRPPSNVTVTAAPAGGSASTGTPWGYGASDPVLAAPSAITGSSPWAFQQLLSLTPDTAYWFDLAVSTKNTSDAAEVANISMTFAELP